MQKSGYTPTKTGSSFLVGFFLASRNIRRGNPWTNVLIVFIMVFTFLNLVVVSGILVGLVEGVSQSIGDHFMGDIIISNLKQREYIEQSGFVIGIISAQSDVLGYTPRYISGGTIEPELKKLRKPSELPEKVSALFAGINPEQENAVASLSDLLVEGSYLEPDDYDQVMVGALLLKEYAGFESEAFPVLSDVSVGSKIRITVNGNVRDVVVKGILRSKVDEIDRRVFFVDSQLRGLIGRFDYNVDEIAIRLKEDADPVKVKEAILAGGAGEYAKVQTLQDAEPKFVKDIKNTFAILGAIISSIGLVVASITIFIVIFINAITRRKFIGILKGIGVHSKAIEFAYIIQSMFYALMGTVIGSALVFLVLKPYIDVHPINFPFSDGILVATPEGTLVRIGILFLATLLAGYIPARMVVKQNTLDAILGR